MIDILTYESARTQEWKIKIINDIEILELANISSTTYFKYSHKKGLS